MQRGLRNRLGPWLTCSIALGVCTAAQAVIFEPVVLSEQPDWVIADSYYTGPGPQPDPPYAWPIWPVVRLDVSSLGAPLGVYRLIVGAQPGFYDWTTTGTPTMMFGNPWEPLDFYANPRYLPQKDNGDGLLDWTSELLPVQHTAAGPIVGLMDPTGLGTVSFLLPGAFATYDHVYEFATTGPFMACGGGCYPDSVPLMPGASYSFYVTGGLASPMVYLDASDFKVDGSLAGTYNGGISAAVPEPAAAILFGAGLGLLAALRRSSTAQAGASLKG